jgi:hypothetical protein
MTTALATIPALPAARKDLAAFLAACTSEQLVFLCYEAHEMPEYDHLPDWFFDACYDESERRLEGLTVADFGPLEVVAAPSRLVLA